MAEASAGAPASAPDPAGRGRRTPPPASPTESRWGFDQGDEVVPGISAIKLLGGGYRYEAYLAWSERLRSLVVIKVVRPGLVDDERALRGLGHEVGLLARLSHPVLVRAFGHDLTGPRPHLVLEHLEGPRLSSMVRRYGPLQPEQLAQLGLQLLAAAHYLASESVVHLDIKPSNVIMGGPPRLIDLSVARTIERCASIRSPIGTDAFMAPEQCVPGEGLGVGPPADVWGVGATLFQAAGGRAFPEGNPDSELPPERWPQLDAEPTSLEGLVRGELAEAISSCLAFDPARRPSPAELSERLEIVLDGLPQMRIAKLKPRPIGS